ncbi:hypothetical protein SLEP1_g30175 [Rubroshorea leprosula]|uniref:RCD1 WWE domain-containing protein n=1 Tax=Rubroshorea leprosula TaxID=152421 RepID=A0AAV5K9W8_9ROSI|nr:hypothetical protein SLEP1_g30175 [Rubroshorea leprosula]
MAHATEASTSRVDIGNHSSNTASRKGKEIQLVPSSYKDAKSHGKNEAMRKRNEVTIPLTLHKSVVKRSDSAHDDLSFTELLLRNYKNFTRSVAPSRAMVEMLIDGSKYLFDFRRMLQIDSETENYWSISWIKMNMASIFFLKVSIGKEGENTELENNKYIESYVNANASITHKVDLIVELDDSSLKRKRAEFEAFPPNPIMAFPTPPVVAPLIFLRMC